jgi:sirohydrochlorin cobaltochelatase
MIIVLAMHGMPPKDFPEKEKMEFLRLHSQHSKPGALTPEQIQRHDELDAKMRAWPRTPQNDSFHTASYRIADEMKKSNGVEVLVAFNEFCSPAVAETLDKAAAFNQGEVVVVTPMLTRGGSHAELEIPEDIEKARQRNPQTSFRYAWPFDSGFVARFLNEQVGKSSKSEI